MNKASNNSPKEYKMDIATTYPQTYLDGSNISSKSLQSDIVASQNCQTCTGNCTGCQNNTYFNQPGLQGFLPLLLKSLGNKGDLSSLMPLISKFSPNSSQDSANTIQNLLNLMQKPQNKNDKNISNNTPSSDENPPSKKGISQIDSYKIIKDL